MKFSRLVLALSICLIASNSLQTKAHAFDFSIGKVLNGAKAAIEAEKEKQARIKKEEEAKESDRLEKLNPKVSNSQIFLNKTLAADSTWALVQISKNQFKEDVILPVRRGSLESVVYLRDGAGSYQIKIFATNKAGKYDGSYTYVSELNAENKDQRDLLFLLPSVHVQSDDQQIIHLAAQLTEGLVRDEEKVKSIHDFVAQTVSYNDEGLFSGRYLTDPMDAVSVLNNPVTVCAGYSNLFAAIVRAAGIKVAVVYGKAKTTDGMGDHAWNEVYIGNVWKIVDVTWDDLSVLRYDYFFPTEEMFARDHIKEKIMMDF